MKCNYCGCKDNEIIYNYARFERQNILKCKNCSLVFLELKNTQDEIEKFYEKTYRKTNDLPIKSAGEMFNDPVIKQDCEDRLKWITDKLGDLSGLKILEIGSSSGYFLDVLSSAGADVKGVELTKEYANFARDLGFFVFTEPIENLRFKEEFDLVVSFHTLEHLFDPKNVIWNVFRSLKTNGIFMGEVPNQDDWRLKIFDNEVVKRFHYDPNHYYYFSPLSLVKYLNNVGFNETILSTVERYNSFIQMKRILTGQYCMDNINEILKNNVFAKPYEDVRIPDFNNFQETEFNRIFHIGINKELMGNCLRWISKR